MPESTKKSSVDLLSGNEGRVIFRFSLPIVFSYKIHAGRLPSLGGR